MATHQNTDFIERRIKEIWSSGLSTLICLRRRHQKPDIQGEHTPESDNFELGKSELAYTDPKDLLDRGAGFGQAMPGVARGKPGFKEVVTSAKT